MPVLVWAAIAVTILFVATVAVCLYNGYDEIGPLAAVLLLIAAVVLWGVVPIVPFAARHSRDRCETYAAQTEREVRFLRQSFMSWNCYVLTDNGWVTRSNVYSGVPVDG